MANLTNGTSLRQIATNLAGLQVPIKAASALFQGAMVALLTASGYAVRGGTAATGPVLGVSRADAATPATDGAVNNDLLVGVFVRPLDATNPPTIVHVGHPVYAKDDSSISYASADGPIAGVLLGFEDSSGDGQIFVHPATNSALAYPLAGTTLTGAVSTIADAPAKAAVTSIVAALKAKGATDSTT